MERLSLLALGVKEISITIKVRKKLGIKPCIRIILGVATFHKLKLEPLVTIQIWVTD